MSDKAGTRADTKASTMAWARLAPCKNCPFRRDVTPFLRPERVAEILEGVMDEGKPFLCHETTRWSDDEEEAGENYMGKAADKFCAGAVILAREADVLHQNQLVRIAERLGADFRTVKGARLIYRSRRTMQAAYDVPAAIRRTNRPPR